MGVMQLQHSLARTCSVSARRTALGLAAWARTGRRARSSASGAVMPRDVGHVADAVDAADAGEGGDPDELLPCLSVRQPWAWLIVHGGKDIENRDWATKRRGRVLIHAAKGMTQAEWGRAWDFAAGSGASPKALEAGLTRMNVERGGIVGSVEIVDCVAQSTSRWFMGRYGFVLRDPKPLPFVPWKGALGFFGVPRSALAAAARPTGDQR